MRECSFPNPSKKAKRANEDDTGLLIEIERKRLAIDEQRLIIEQQRLQLEQQRLQVDSELVKEIRSFRESPRAQSNWHPCPDISANAPLLPPVHELMARTGTPTGRRVMHATENVIPTLQQFQ